MLNSTLNDEMSQMFDVLYNNVTSNQAPGLNEYEKSVFLTKAQNQLLVEYFNNRTDGVGGGFDGSQKRQYDFSSLIKTAKLDSTEVGELDKLDRRSQCFLFPKDYFLSVNEMLSDNKYQYTVLPIDYNEYYRLMQKPYAFPVKKAAWRLITGKKEVTESEETYEVPVVEIIGRFFSEIDYKLRYVKKPAPIILDNLNTEYQGSVSIEGQTAASSCELPAETHQEILERAVTLAKIAWAGGTATQAAAQQQRN